MKDFVDRVEMIGWNGLEYFLCHTMTNNYSKLIHLRLSKIEWEQAKFLLNILLPFNACSARLEQTTRPGISKMF